MTSPTSLARDPVARSHLDSLDGFRAVMALWVVLGHISYAVRFSAPIISSPAMAVDVFMVLTGFLMVHTWKADLRAPGASSSTVLAFYASRFFRIAPAFYFLLLVSYFVLNSLSTMHAVSATALPPPWITDRAGFDPDPHWNFETPVWLLSHLTFLFGLIPGLENSSTLPEWSLSLEMQFYIALPLLLLCFRRVPFIVLAIIFSALCIVSPRLLGGYNGPGVYAGFSQPCVLPYRLNAFAAGMILSFWLKAPGNAGAKGEHRGRFLTLRNGLMILGMAVCVLPLGKLVTLLYGLFVALVLVEVPILSWFFGLRAMRWLGDISYSIYLSHLLVLTPVIYLLITRTAFVTWQPELRFLLAVAIILPIVVLVSWLNYKAVELRFIRLGRSVVARMRGTPGNP